MEDEKLENDRLGLRVLGLFVLYLVVGLAPAVLAGAGTAGRLVVEETLASGQRLVPAFDHGGLAVGLGLAVSWVAAPLVTLAVAWRVVGDSTVRALLTVTVLLVHSVVVCGGLTASGTSLWASMSDGRLSDRLASPDKERRAFLYKRTSAACGWDVYMAEDLEPVSHHQFSQPCDCDGMLPAVLAWDAGAPVMQDPGGQPYSCPPPPHNCAAVGGGAGWLVVGAVLLVTRRRRARSTARRGASGPSGCPS